MKRMKLNGIKQRLLGINGWTILGYRKNKSQKIIMKLYNYVRNYVF